MAMPLLSTVESVSSNCVGRPFSRLVWICPPRSSDGRSIVGHSCGCSTTPSSEM